MNRPEKNAIRKVAVANRGEIAARILRACLAHGVASAALCSEADREAPYLSLADEVVCIGPAAAAESYLDPQRVVDGALRAGADALHPGYGFLSENADFAELCEQRGIRFIGPPAAAIRRLGDKAAAKSVAAAAGVPVVPGCYSSEQSAEALTAEAEKLGPPLIIKATAGGGGRGMRVVRDLSEFALALNEAQREATATFGCADVLLERYLDRPRHIEFQIFGDAQGRVHSLHERECSIQRRHQKVLEESPSPAVDSELRAEMAAAAIRIGEAVGYRSAGTVEFLLETRAGQSRFYFLEVNTRLQVEHPITEARTGVDLVRMQIATAEGAELPELKEPVPTIGHAFEARINAEDPSRGFAPSLGVILHWAQPSGPGIRVDAGVRRGSEVTPHYDSMLAKLIVHAADRPQAVARLEQALQEFHVLGVATNIPYLLSIVRDAEFRSGHTHIRFLEERLSGWIPESDVPDEVLLVLAATALRQRTATASENHRTGARQPADMVWRQDSGWRNV